MHMKRHILLASIALAVAATACAPAAAPPATEPAAPAAEADTATPAAVVEEPPVNIPVTGGYGPASLDDAQVKEASDFAVSEIYKRDPTRALVESVTAEQQVVAGMNYNFEIKMSGGATFHVTVHRNLQNEMSIGDYEKVS
jgi:opacity protein-like surface antigen